MIDPGRLSLNLITVDHWSLREAVERCEDARASLELNPSEDLVLAALLFRLERLVGGSE